MSAPTVIVITRDGEIDSVYGLFGGAEIADDWLDEQAWFPSPGLHAVITSVTEAYPDEPDLAAEVPS